MLASKKSQVQPLELDQAATGRDATRNVPVLKRSRSAAAHRAQFYTKGTAALRALCVLFVQIHIPVAIVAIWMCGYYALISYLVVRQFCTDAVTSTPVGSHTREGLSLFLLPQLFKVDPVKCICLYELSQRSHSSYCAAQTLEGHLLQGTTQGFLDCVYVTHGGYSAQTLSKLLFLFFWLTQQLWLVGFTAVLAYAMMPAWFRLRDKVAIGVTVTVTALIMLICATKFDRSLNSAIYFADQGTACRCSCLLNILFHPH